MGAVGRGSAPSTGRSARGRPGASREGRSVSVHAVFNLLGFIANAALAFFVLSRDDRAKPNRLYAVFAGLVAWWSAAKLGVTLSDDAESAATWYRASGPGWVFITPIYLHFVGAYTRLPIFGKVTRPVLGTLYAVAAALSVSCWIDDWMLREMIPGPWGYTHVPGPVYETVLTPFLMGGFIYGLFRLIPFTARAATRDDRMRGLLLVVGILVPFVGGTTTNLILPVMGWHVAELAVPLTTVNALVIAYAMVRYRLLSLTVEYAARTIITTMPDALVVLDADARITLVNPALPALTGHSSGDLAGREMDAICAKPWFGAEFRERLERDGAAKMEVDFLTEDGAHVPVSLSIAPLTDRRGITVGYVAVAKDIRDVRDLISRIEEAKRELERIAVLDPLTGVYNRRFLGEKLRDEFLRGVRYGTCFSVIVADLDYFKEINDTRGHAIGDKVLREIGAMFRRGLRPTDVITRYGGDEFVLVLPETPATEAVIIAERLRDAFHDLHVNGEPTRIAASFGVSTFDPRNPVESEEVLLRQADAALYDSKRLGRNRVTHWDRSSRTPRPP